MSVDGMHIFSWEVENVVTDRFYDVSKALEPALIEHLRRMRIEFRPLSLQLMVLGVTEDVAKPWIVVLCPKSVKSKVVSFLKTDFAKSICQGTSSLKVSFNTVVVGRPIKPTSGDFPEDVFLENVSLNGLNSWTPRIKVVYSGTARYATIVGFLCTVDAQGNNSFYGLTAGHILPPDHSQEEAMYGVSEDYDSDGISDSHNDEAHSDTISLSDHSEDSVFEDEIHDEGDSESDQRSWTLVGNVSRASYSPSARTTIGQ
jgi:hypothetical protein